jgi:hypothetical protein
VEQRYLPLQDNIASVAYWYQTPPTSPFPALPSADELEVNGGCDGGRPAGERKRSPRGRI